MKATIILCIALLIVGASGCAKTASRSETLAAGASDYVKPEFIFSNLANLGSTVNSIYHEGSPDISSDGLSLYFDSRRPNPSGSLGNNDLYVTRRATTADDWSIPVNLGPKINTSQIQYSPNILNDDMTMFFDSRITNRDIWMTTRKSINGDWDTAERLEPPMNTSYIDTDPSISFDWSIIYFVSNRPGGSGGFDLWMARIMKK